MINLDTSILSDTPDILGDITPSVYVIYLTYSLRSPYTLGLFGRLIETIFLYLFIGEYYHTIPQKSRRHAVNNTHVISDIHHITYRTNRTFGPTHSGVSYTGGVCISTPPYKCGVSHSGIYPICPFCTP